MNENRRHSLLARLCLLTAILVILGIALVATYVRAFSADPRGLALGFYDRWAYFAPMAYYLDYSLHRGAFPEWNPLLSCGAPFAANPQALAFYPPQLLRGLLTPHPTPLNAVFGMAALTVLHLLLAGAATFYLARAHGMTRVACMTASLAFVCGAAMTRRTLDVPPFVFILAWLPVLLLLIRGAVEATRFASRIRYALGGALAFAACVLAGFPQFVIYTGLCCAVYGASLQWSRAKTLGADRVKGRVPWDIALFVAAAIIGLLLAAPLLLPALEYAQHSARAKAVGESYTYLDFRVSPMYLLRGLIEYPGVTWAGSCGIRMAGAGAFLLALAALWHPRKRDTAVFGLIFLLMIDCALAPQLPLGKLVSWLAPFRVESPSRASIFACFALAMLAGFGVDAATWALPTRRQTALRALFHLAAGAAVLALLWKWAVPDPFVPVGIEAWYIPAALACVALIAPLLLNCSKALTPWLRLVLALLVCAELIAWNRHYVPHVAGIYPYPGPTQALANGAQIPATAARGTACGGFENQPLCQNQPMMLLAPSMGGYDPLFVDKTRRFACGPGNETSYYRELTPREVTERTPRGLTLLKRRFWLAQQYVEGPPPDKHTSFAPTTTTFLEGAGSLPVRRVVAPAVADRPVSPLASPTSVGLGKSGREAKADESEGTGEYVATIRLPEFAAGPCHSALSLICTASATGRLEAQFMDPVGGQSEWGYARDLAAQTTELQYALPDYPNVQAKLRFKTRAANATIRVIKMTVCRDMVADEGSRIVVRESEPDSVTVALNDLPDTRVLSFIESAYPGWTATVDGEAVPIYPAFDAFQAVVVPKGTHEVRFAYRSEAIRRGLLFATAGAALAAALLLLTYHPRFRTLA